MKRFILLVFTAFIFFPSYSQNFFQNLIKQTKQKLVNTGKEELEKLKATVTDKVDGKVEELTILFQGKVNNILNKALPEEANNSNTKNDGNYIDPKKFNSSLSKEYPNFFKIYTSTIQTDTLLKNVVFGYRDESQNTSSGKYICMTPKDNTIFFDLSYFEDKSAETVENKLCFVFLEMLGRIHLTAENKSINSRSLITSAFNYAVNKSLDFAKNNNCCPLEYAVSELNKRKTNLKNGRNPSYLNQVEKMSSDCNDFFENHCK